MLRIITGAVLNANDAHPGKYNVDARFARGVAKRAVGTLSAQLADVLAAEVSRPSRMASGDLANQGHAGGSLGPSGKRSAQSSSRTKRASDRVRSLALIERIEVCLMGLVSLVDPRGSNTLINAMMLVAELRKRAERGDA